MAELIATQIEKTLRSLLKEEIGEFRPGMPAIAIEPPQMPNTGSGLQVTIARQPTKLSQSLYRWKVTLRQHDRTELGFKKFDNAIAKIRDRFPLSVEVISPFEPDKFTQAVFQIDGYQHYSGLSVS